MFRNIKFLLLFFPFFGVLFYSGCSEDDPLPPAEEHFEAIGVYLTASGIEIVSILRGVTDDTLTVPDGALGDGIDVKFYNENEQIINPPTGEQTLAFEIEDTSIVSVFQHPGEEGGFEFHLRGKQTGTTHIELFVMHEGHSDFRSGKIPVRVEDQGGTHGEPVGLKLYDEESGTLLVTVNADSSVTGSLSVAAGDTTDHIELMFFDENNIEFQPPVPEHSLGYMIENGTIAGIDPPTIDEPWAFRIIGNSAGSTTIRLILNHDNHAEYTSPPVPINVP
jgi:hypothetical protein